ncbi:Uncharacterised protein [Proteus mirabilis]|uniref:Uncharacterized protein n=1 Tax=Proteus mirabilis TaxID=584 RepID=A0A2X2BN60_PROMI|nr:Uncharacterised protein [Proteus mirabilis]
MKKLSGRIYLALVLIASLFIVFEKASLIYTALLSVSVYFIIFYAVFCFIVPRAILGNHNRDTLYHYQVYQSA